MNNTANITCPKCGAPLKVDEKPFFFAEAVIKNAIGQTLLVDGSITRIHEKENETDGFLITLRDVTEIKRMTETIDYQASHDTLTGLSNRDEFSFSLKASSAAWLSCSSFAALLARLNSASTDFSSSAGRDRRSASFPSGVPRWSGSGSTGPAPGPAPQVPP